MVGVHRKRCHQLRRILTHLREWIDGWMFLCWLSVLLVMTETALAAVLLLCSPPLAALPTTELQ